MIHLVVLYLILIFLNLLAIVRIALNWYLCLDVLRIVHPMYI